MKRLDPYEQLLNVMEGYTADGQPRGGPIAIPGGNRAIGSVGLLLVALFRDLEQHMPDDMKLDRVRTAIILVFIRWLKLTGVTSELPLKRMIRRVATPPTH
ncbi:hypothetical protein [Hyphomicrobium sp. DY-1]|uniref:hypothetical protein n=1 Tax=Hyphomicrobium sp. DY-1 TaxID=3075650 RepID=UPI0039C43E49